MRKRLTKYQRYERAKQRIENRFGRILDEEELMSIFQMSGAYTQKSEETLRRQDLRRQYNAMLATVKDAEGIRRYMRTKDRELIDLDTEEDAELLESVAVAQEPQLEKLKKNIEKAKRIAYIRRNQLRIEDLLLERQAQ